MVCAVGRRYADRSTDDLVHGGVIPYPRVASWREIPAPAQPYE